MAFLCHRIGIDKEVLSYTEDIMLTDFPPSVLKYARQALSVTLEQHGIRAYPGIGAETMHNISGRHLAVRLLPKAGYHATAEAEFYPNEAGDGGRLHLHHATNTGRDVQLPQGGQSDVYDGRDENGLPKLVHVTSQATA